MKIVQGDEIELKRGLEHRGGTFHGCVLAEGEAGRLDNFQLNYGELGGDFYSPRHRHNFEQIRYQMAGSLDYSRDGKLKTGMVGYFPEGTSYGPQVPSPDEKAVTVVFQCGGASGSGYLSQAQIQAGMRALREVGEFKDGVFRRKDGVPGKKNQDGFQAIWEHVNGRPLEFPKQRYARPVIMDPANFQWIPVAGRPGAYAKLLGVFSEARTEAEFVKLDAGAAYQAREHGLYLVTRGTGRAAGAPLRRLTTVHVDRGETVEIAAETEMELLRYGLPILDHLLEDDSRVPAQAAE